MLCGIMGLRWKSLSDGRENNSLMAAIGVYGKLSSENSVFGELGEFPLKSCSQGGRIEINVSPALSDTWLGEGSETGMFVLRNQWMKWFWDATQWEFEILAQRLISGSVKHDRRATLHSVTSIKAQSKARNYLRKNSQCVISWQGESDLGETREPVNDQTMDRDWIPTGILL